MRTGSVPRDERRRRHRRRDALVADHAAPPPRPGRSRASGRARKLGGVTSSAPCGALPTSAPSAFSAALISDRCTATPSSSSTRLGRRWIAFGLYGVGYASTMPGAISPPASCFEQRRGPIGGARHALDVDAALEAERRLGAQLECGARCGGCSPDRSRPTRAAPSWCARSPRCRAPPITPASAIGCVAGGDQQIVGRQLPLDAVERAQRARRAGPPDDDLRADRASRSRTRAAAGRARSSPGW